MAAALATFSATQHMLGTQLVDIDEMPDGEGCGGGARMQSYLNALHEWPNGNIGIYRGTYFDKVRYTPEVGWQIYDMNLVLASWETRVHAVPEEESSEDES